MHGQREYRDVQLCRGVPLCPVCGMLMEPRTVKQWSNTYFCVNDPEKCKLIKGEWDQGSNILFECKYEAVPRKT